MSANNKTPEQLKVTELREELKKRGIATKGLKRELVEKLEAALRAEEDNAAAAAAATGEAALGSTNIVEETTVVPDPLQDAVASTTVEETVVMQVEVASATEVEAGAEEKEAEKEAETVADAEPENVAEQMTAAEAAEADAGGAEEAAAAAIPGETVITEIVIEEKVQIETTSEGQVSIVEEKTVFEEKVEVESMVEDQPEVQKIEATEARESIVTDESKVEMQEDLTSQVEETPVVPEQPKEDAVQEEPKEEAGEVSVQPDDSTKAVDKVETEDRTIEEVEKPVDSDKTPVEVEGENGGVWKENGDETSADKVSEAPMDVDAEAQAGLKRKEYEEEQPLDQNKRQRKWNSGKDLSAEADGKASESSVNVSGGKSSGTRSLADRLSRPLVSPRSDVANNGRNVTQPSKNPTTSLRIERFVRPFTLKALKDLLAETGNFSDFWIDHIKTHCYITYSSVDEATATRDALSNRKWPPIHGNQLTCEFVEPEEVKKKCESGSNDKAPSNMSIALPRGGTAVSALTSPHTPASPFPTPTPRERQNQQQKREPEPIVTLDDLFKKTIAKPSIYYLPLTDEEVAAKRAAKT